MLRNIKDRSYAGVNYKVSGDLGFERAKEEYINSLRERFEEFRNQSTAEIIDCLNSTPRASGIAKFKEYQSHNTRNVHI